MTGPLLGSWDRNSILSAPPASRLLTRSMSVVVRVARSEVFSPCQLPIPATLKTLGLGDGSDGSGFSRGRRASEVPTPRICAGGGVALFRVEPGDRLAPSCPQLGASIVDRKHGCLSSIAEQDVSAVQIGSNVRTEETSIELLPKYPKPASAIQTG